MNRPEYNCWTSFDSIRKRIASKTGEAPFYQEYLGEPWIPSPAETALRNLADQYHDLVDEFDRHHCSLRDEHGEGQPATPNERASINRHALDLRRDLFPHAQELGFTWTQWQRAIVDASERRRQKRK